MTDYIAFDFDVCTKVKELAPKAHVEYLNGDKTPEEIAAAGLDGIDYHFNVYKKKEEYMAEMQDKKLTTNVWTVNDEANHEMVSGKRSITSRRMSRSCCLKITK